MRIIPALLVAALAMPVLHNNALAQTKKDKPKTETKDNEDEELMDMLDDKGAPKKKEYTSATFKATRIVNGHSIENVGKGVLDFRIAHRFGSLAGGASSFFGLDGAVTALAFDYGVTDWLMVGIMRSTYEKEYEGYTKIKLLRQTTNNSMPVSVSYMGAMSVQSMPAPTLPAGQEWFFSNRLFYVNQLLIARKMNRWLSLQLMPTHIHYNLVPTSGEPNNTVAIGLGGRIKLSNRIALTGEYHYRLPDAQLNGYKNAVSVGVDIETGGHVFQLIFTNASTISERAFIGQTVDDWGKGDIHFGFNISRVFTIVRPKGFDESRNKVW